MPANAVRLVADHAEPSANELKVLQYPLTHRVARAVLLTVAGNAVLRLPVGALAALKTTSGLERLHGEVKRRIRAVGPFPSRVSALRPITAVSARGEDSQR